VTKDQILQAFGSVRSFTQGDRRAPHKPFLLLIALAAVQRGHRWIRFSEVEERLRTLLTAFGPHVSAPHPEYPFWRLQSDGIWTIPEAPRLIPHVNVSGDVRVSALRAIDARGGFPPELFAALGRDPVLVNVLAARILEESLPATVHEQVLDEVGFRWTVITRRVRDPGFRDEILRIYERRRAVCGYDGRLGNSDLPIEACHIKWHSAGGPDALDYGVAMCSFHHVAFDRGALSINDEYSIQVSQHVAGQSHVETLLVQYAGQPLRMPQQGNVSPDPAYLGWHRHWVFRPPARAA
jgi:putative restriction endonuclease